MLTKTLTPARYTRPSSINILNQDNLWEGDADCFKEEVECVEDSLGYKLNPDKAMWVYAQLHELDEDLGLIGLKKDLQKLTQIAIRQMTIEKDEERRNEIENTIINSQHLYDWFDKFSELNVLSNLPRVF